MSVQNYFEKTFQDGNLKSLIDRCDNYPLAATFLKYLPEGHVLEAGSGDGRWVGWLISKGWRATGLDWSEKLCKEAEKYIPDGQFASGDMRKMPFDDNSFSSLIALGSIEHVVEGPVQILKEFRRILKTDGTAIITVPDRASVRKLIRIINYPFHRLRTSLILRKILGKNTNGKSYSKAYSTTVKKWSADINYAQNGWFFYQYNFTRTQMLELLKTSSFHLVKDFNFLPDEGLIQTFGRLAGHYSEKNEPILSIFGKILKMLLPDSSIGHMRCYIVTNKK